MVDKNASQFKSPKGKRKTKTVNQEVVIIRKINELPRETLLNDKSRHFKTVIVNRSEKG